MHREPNPGGKLKPKVAQTAVFKCPACGEITPDAYVKECGIKHNIDSQLIAVVADDGKKRLYLEATPEQERAAQVNAPKNVPHGDLPNFPKRFSPPSFGLTDYADLFTNRQLVFITSMMDLTKEMQSDIEKDALGKGFADDEITFADGGCGALAYAEAVRIALILTISKLLDRCSNICSWSTSSGGSLRNVFSRAAMPMIWDYAEGNPFAGAGGSFANALSRTCDTIALLPAGVDGITKVADAVMPNDVKDAMIVTTLPYYDRASYSDLSDFFYVWMKYGLGDLYPTYFSGAISPKQEDMTAFSHRYGGDKKKADMIYGESLAVAMKNLYVSTSADFPSLVGFIYKGNNSSDNEELSEWEYFIDAVCSAGFSVTASWPLGRKYEESIELAESRGIPVTVVLRKKEEDSSQITRRSFVAAVKREVPTLIEETSSKVGIMDLRASVIGQALNIYTRNKQVLDADGSSMKPHMASRIIEQEIDTLISAYYEEASKAVSEEETDHGRES
jgi:putative DNA methylase